MQLLVTKSDHHFSFFIAFAVADTPSPLQAAGYPTHLGGGIVGPTLYMSTCLEMECFKNEMIQSVSEGGRPDLWGQGLRISKLGALSHLMLTKERKGNTKIFNPYC